MKKILLHVCCAPCSPYVIELLKEKFNITLYFYGPNIHPREEYLFRLEEVKRFSQECGLKLITGDYDAGEWFSEMKGLEAQPEGGKRCERCFTMRLQQSCSLSKKGKFDLFATVLTVSPHKNSAVINTIGADISKQASHTFYTADFKKNNGFQKSVALGKKFNLKRQNYCGCLFSQRRDKKRPS
ncbi:MAG: epoxyqueuosine reductase QueH [Nitrospinota bacterium]